MSKRHEKLIPLTHDHHHALGHARRLKLSAGTDPEELAATAQAFVDFFDSDSVHHFREEEEIVFPLAINDDRASDLLVQAVGDHLRIHALVARLRHELDAGEVTGATAEQTATALEQHIRWEEQKLFPLLEEILSEDQLATVSLAPRRRAEVQAGGGPSGPPQGSAGGPPERGRLSRASRALGH